MIIPIRILGKPDLAAQVFHSQHVGQVFIHCHIDSNLSPSDRVPQEEE